MHARLNTEHINMKTSVQLRFGVYLFVKKKQSKSQVNTHQNPVEFGLEGVKAEV